MYVCPDCGMSPILDILLTGVLVFLPLGFHGLYIIYDFTLKMATPAGTEIL
jgi:hypothetical protein